MPDIDQARADSLASSIENLRRQGDSFDSATARLGINNDEIRAAGYVIAQRAVARGGTVADVAQALDISHTVARDLTIRIETERAGNDPFRGRLNTREGSRSDIDRFIGR